MGLDVCLLGFFRLSHNGEQLSSVNQPRLQSLLAYLILNSGNPISRQHLAFLFWPDLSEAQARNNLRQGLYQLRQAFPGGENYFFTDANTVQWRPEAFFRLDVAEFHQALSSAQSASQSGNKQAMQAALERALSLFQGELLPSCYDNWILPEREKLHQAHLGALDSIVQLLEEQGALDKAIPFAQRLVLNDPLYENGYRLLMRLYALNKDRAGALRAYHTCANVLQHELGVEPEPATYQAYLKLLNKPASFSEPALPPRISSRMPLIGRDHIWKQLQIVCQRVCSGGPEIVLLEGEAGIGKTRLAEDLLEWAAHQGHNIAKTRAYTAEGNLAYEPLAAWLRSEACKEGYANIDKIWLTEVARLLPELLAEIPGLPGPEPLKEAWQRQRFFQGLAHAIFAMRQPLFLLIDDLQWCDGETLEWLHYLLRVDPHSRFLLIGTIRTEEITTNPALKVFLADLGSGRQVTEISLGRLDAVETARLALSLVGRELDFNEALSLFHETEGNPLFVIETLRSGAVFQKGDPERLSAATDQRTTGRSFSNELPARVRAVIAGRLAQLTPPARDLACLAATIGRSFDYELLSLASGADPDELILRLDELWQHRIIREVDENGYDFTHDKLREVAYSQTASPKRRQLHLSIASALESMHTLNLDPYSSQIANHLDLAGSPAQAIPYYHRAAMVAQRIGANQEAVGLLKKALALLNRLNDAVERDERQLEIQTALAVCLVDSQGHGAPEVMHAFQLAQVICARLGRPLSPPILRGLGLVNIASANYRQSLRFGEQLLQLGEDQADSVLIVEGYYLCGAALLWLGEFSRAREMLEGALVRYRPEKSHVHIALYSQDPRVICLSRLGDVLWCQGYPDQALATSQQALEYGRQCGHPFSLAYAMVWNLILLGHISHFDEAMERAKAAIAYCVEQQLVFWLLHAEMLHGWILAECGEPDLGAAKIRKGMDDLWSMGLYLQRPMFLTLLAVEMAKSGRLQEGLVLIQEALGRTEDKEERWYEAEIIRCQGEMLAQQGEDAAAESAFYRALKVAGSQGAKMLELRAALSLAQLWVGQGKRQGAFQLLAPLYDRFSEGFQLPDLRIAQSILASLQSSFS